MPHELKPSFMSAVSVLESGIRGPNRTQLTSASGSSPRANPINVVEDELAPPGEGVEGDPGRVGG